VSERRTLPATARKLARAQKRYGLPRSLELTAALSLGLAVFVLPPVAEQLWAAERGLWGRLLAAAGAPVPATPAFDRAAAASLAIEFAGLLGAIALAAALATFVQRGAAVRLGGGDGASFGAGPPTERFAPAGYSLAKWAVLAAVLLWPWSDALRGMLASWQRAPHELTALTGGLLRALLERAVLALALIGTIDLLVQHASFRRRLRMSRRELQDEQRESEGDPHARDERRRRAHELRFRATLLELGEVDLIVCDEDRTLGMKVRGSDAVVWIKADGELGRRMRREAERRSLPVAFDSSLTDALYAFEPNESLPSPLKHRVREHLTARPAERSA
jgi:flagellar biosynthetic protein FlhB